MFASEKHRVGIYNVIVAIEEPKLTDYYLEINIYFPQARPWGQKAEY